MKTKILLISLILFTASLFSQEPWLPQECCTDETLLDVYFLSEEEGWSVGENGTIIHYDGEIWSDVEMNMNDSSISWTSVHFVDENNGWISGFDNVSLEGVIYYCDGSSWELQTSIPEIHINSLFMVDQNNGWSVGEYGTILYYNGYSWEAQESGTAEDLCDVSFTDLYHGWAVGGNEEGIILMYNYLLGNWMLQETASFNIKSVFFLDSNNGWVVGVGAPWAGLCLQYDGQNWEYIEIVDEGRFYGFSDIFMTDSINGWLIGGRVGFFGGSADIYQCLDNEWSQVQSIHWGGMSDPTAIFNSIFLTDGNHGWIVGGYESNIYHYNPLSVGCPGEVHNGYKNHFSVKSYPNPFSKQLELSYTIKETSNVTIKLYNISGQLEQVILDNEVQQGEQKLLINTYNLASGVYFYTLVCGNNYYSGKLIKY
jgi:photosystem II stability/assembly factor-like uncharacterized protein